MLAASSDIKLYICTYFERQAISDTLLMICSLNIFEKVYSVQLNITKCCILSVEQYDCGRDPKLEDKMDADFSAFILLQHCRTSLASFNCCCWNV